MVSLGRIVLYVVLLQQVIARITMHENYPKLGSQEYVV